MNRNSWISLLTLHLFVASLTVAVPLVAAADGNPASAPRARSGAEKVGADAAVTDPRLPPVFPGEEVRDGDKIIKTWSTSGPVAVSQPPEPWGVRGGATAPNNSGVGVIVDARRDRDLIEPKR
jgi:hypothetical protein